MAMPDQPTEWRRGRRAAEQPRFTGEQLQAFRQAWAEFSDPAWEPFKRACMERGFMPPQGAADDDPDTSLRSKLWRIADDRPHDLGHWVSESAGQTLYAVVADVFERYAAIRTDAGVDDQEWIQAKAGERHAARRAVTQIAMFLDKNRENIDTKLDELRAKVDALRDENAKLVARNDRLLRDFAEVSALRTEIAKLWSALAAVRMEGSIDPELRGHIDELLGTEVPA